MANIKQQFLQTQPISGLARAIFRWFILFTLDFRQFLSLVVINDLILTLYFHWCGLSPCSIQLDPETTMNFWVPKQRRFSRPVLVLVHGYGGNSKWQWLCQIKQLTAKFDVYVPDLIFFGKSFTKSTDRSEFFQAKCIGETMKRFGVERFSVCGISYGGFVVFRLAHMYAEEIEKVVIMSSGISVSNEQRAEFLEREGRRVTDILLPQNPEDLRTLMKRSFFRPPQWIPSFYLQDFINVMYRDYRKERIELIEGLLIGNGNAPPLHVLNQETLIIWGEKDDVFPSTLAHQLKRHLGDKSRLSIIKDVGHAAQLESPWVVTDLIKLFLSD